MGNSFSVHGGTHTLTVQDWVDIGNYGSGEWYIVFDYWEEGGYPGSQSNSIQISINSDTTMHAHYYVYIDYPRGE